MITSSQTLTKEQQNAIAAMEVKLAAERVKAAEEATKKARYKIQVWFKSTRSDWKPMAYTVSLWESGKRLHGGGDEMMFFCKRQPDAPRVTARPFGVGSGKAEQTPDGCGNPIPGENISGELALCPHCMMRWNTSQIGDSLYYYSTAQKAAENLEMWWRKLDCDADLYFKYSPTDPRTIMMARNYSAKKARELKGLSIYPLKNMIRDSASGTPVQTLFKNFITA